MPNLNENQRKAVEIINGPLLIIAGPGSGKTRTLVERVVHMVSSGIKIEKILITTFTERAAKEIITRVSEKVKNLNLNKMYIGTIHSICLKIIDESIEYSRLNKGYIVLERLDQIFFIYSKMREFKKIDGFEDFFEEKKYYNSWLKAKELANYFNKLSETVTLQLKNIKSKKIDFLLYSYEKYLEFIFQENKIDFSLIQRETYEILIKNNKILKKYRRKIEYLMVDEYQDTNEIQEKLIFLIAGEKKNICVVGDDDQGIYRFRGATIENILHFREKMGKECKFVKLELNYRSEKDIVDFTEKWINSLYWENSRYEKKIVSVKEDNSKKVVKLSEKNSFIKWHETLAKFLIFLKKTNKIENYNQVAFLFRSVRNNKAISLANYLESAGIGVYNPRATLFFERDEIRIVIGILAYIFISENINNNRSPLNEIEIYYNRCIFLYQKKVSDDVLEKINDLKLKYMHYEKKENFLELFYEILTIGIFEKILEKKEDSVVKNRESYNLAILSKIINKAVVMSKANRLTEKNRDIFINYFFYNHLKFLKKSGLEEYEDEKEFAPEDSVSFLTIHQSKGLEFPIVVVASLESEPDKEKELNEKELIFKQKNGIEPEYRINEFDFWRLYYTAFSRAKNLLVLTCVENEGRVPALPFKNIYESIPDIRSSEEFSFRSLKVEPINKILLKNSYSYTEDYLGYQECPYRYNMFKKYKYEEIKTINNFFGILLHQTLEKINSLLKINENPIDKIEDIFNNNYLALKENIGIVLKKEILDKGMEQLKLYLENIAEWKILQVEEKIEILEEDYIIKGTLDLVIENNDVLEIVDFKTGEIDYNELKKYKKQLEFYATLYERNTGKNIEKGRLYFLKKGQSLEYQFTKEEKITIFNEFKDTIKGIENKVFYKKREIKRCEKCILKQHCKNLVI